MSHLRSEVLQAVRGSGCRRKIKLSNAIFEIVKQLAKNNLAGLPTSFLAYQMPRSKVLLFSQHSKKSLSDIRQGKRRSQSWSQSLNFFPVVRGPAEVCVLPSPIHFIRIVRKTAKSFPAERIYRLASFRSLGAAFHQSSAADAMGNLYRTSISTRFARSATVSTQGNSREFRIELRLPEPFFQTDCRVSILPTFSLSPFARKGVRNL